jgi:hypothetical protein
VKLTWSWWPLFKEWFRIQIKAKQTTGSS